MQLAKQLVSVTLGSIDTGRKSDKLMVPGSLTLAEDVVQVKGGSFGKRFGFSALAKTTDSGTISVGKDDNATASQVTLRTDGAAYAYSTPQGKWLNRGELRGCVPTWRRRAAVNATTGVNSVPPIQGVVTSGGYTYTFSNLAVGYQVTDTAGTIVLSGTFAAGSPRAIVAAGGYVWVFANSTTVSYTYKFDPANPTTGPVQATYGTATAGTITGVDVITDVNGAVVVCEYGPNPTIGGVLAGYFLSRLNTATGGPTAARVTSSGTISGTVTTTSGQFCWVQGDDGTDGTLHFVVGAGAATLLVADVNVTTLAVTGTAYACGSNVLADVGAYRASASEIVVLHTDPSSANVETYFVRRTSTSTGTSVLQLGASVVSRPFTVNSRWHVVVNHSDANDLQHAYYVIDLTSSATGRKVARAMYEEGGGPYGMAYNSHPAVPAGYGRNTGVYVSGTTVILPVLMRPVNTGVYQMNLLSLDFSGAIGRSTAIGGAVIYGGGWPTRQPDGESIHDAAPMMYPRTTGSLSTIAGSIAAGTYQVAYLYAIYNDDGTVTRSIEAASAHTLGAPGGIRATIPSLRFTNSTVYIEAYIGTAGGAVTTMRFHSRTLNVTTTDTTTVDMTTNTQLGELIYTADGSLDNTSPEVFTVSWAWRDRFFYVDANTGDVLYTRPGVAGSGLQFNELLSFSLREGTGIPTAGGAISFDYNAVLKRDGIWTIAGYGPDNFAHDNYEPTKLPGTLGTTNPITVTSRQGLFFQATSGEIWLIDVGRNLVNVSKAWTAYLTSGVTVTSAIDMADDERVLLFLSSGVCLIWDYRFPAAVPQDVADTLGVGYVWRNQSAVGAVCFQETPYYVASDGSVFRQVANQYFDVIATPILRRMRWAHLSAAGLGGAMRVYRMTVDGTYTAAHSILVTINRDFGSGTETFPATLGAAPEDRWFRPKSPRSAMEVTVEDTGSDLTAGGTIEALEIEVGVKPGVRRLSTTQRL